jgi:hypothetical protein
MHGAWDVPVQREMEFGLSPLGRSSDEILKAGIYRIRTNHGLKRRRHRAAPSGLGPWVGAQVVSRTLPYLPPKPTVDCSAVRGADLLFQIVAARYESGSIVISTNRSFRESRALFAVDNTLATALAERLMHRGEAVVIQGASYRMKHKDSDSTSA